MLAALYRCYFVNWELLRSVLWLNTDTEGDEPVSHHLRYTHTMSKTIKWIGVDKIVDEVYIFVFVEHSCVRCE